VLPVVLSLKLGEIRKRRAARKGVDLVGTLKRGPEKLTKALKDFVLIYEIVPWSRYRGFKKGVCSGEGSLKTGVTYRCRGLSTKKKKKPSQHGRRGPSGHPEGERNFRR